MGNDRRGRQDQLWQSGYKGVPAATGDQFAEIGGGALPSALYQDIDVPSGAVLSYAFSHRGRNGTDTMELQIGPPGGPPSFTRRISTGNDAWQQVLGSYVVPPGQNTIRFTFVWVSADLGNQAPGSVVGNLLDGWWSTIPNAR